MSDEIKHECGLAFIRLRKPFSYYLQKYGTATWGLNKLYLLMEKQHNRGQDGAGVAAVKLNVEPGYPFLHRIRSIEPAADFRYFYEDWARGTRDRKISSRIKKASWLDEGQSAIYGRVAAGASSLWNAGTETALNFVIRSSSAIWCPVKTWRWQAILI